MKNKRAFFVMVWISSMDFNKVLFHMFIYHSIVFSLLLCTQYVVVFVSCSTNISSLSAGGVGWRFDVIGGVVVGVHNQGNFLDLFVLGKLVDCWVKVFLIHGYGVDLRVVWYHHNLCSDMFVASVDDGDNLVFDQKGSEQEKEDDKTKVMFIDVFQGVLVVGVKHVLVKTQMLLKNNIHFESWPVEKSLSCSCDGAQKVKQLYDEHWKKVSWSILSNTEESKTANDHEEETQSEYKSKSDRYNHAL